MSYVSESASAPSAMFLAMPSLTQANALSILIIVNIGVEMGVVIMKEDNKQNRVRIDEQVTHSNNKKYHVDIV